MIIMELLKCGRNKSIIKQKKKYKKLTVPDVVPVDSLKERVISKIIDSILSQSLFYFATKSTTQQNRFYSS